jgi:hypothetical protein
VLELSRDPTERLLRRPGLVHEPPACVVVGGIDAEEAVEALVELLGPVRLERLQVLVMRSPAVLVL